MGSVWKEAERERDRKKRKNERRRGNRVDEIELKALQGLERNRRIRLYGKEPLVKEE